MATRVYFDGLDANGLQQLWLSDGTAPGTVEIATTQSSTADGLQPTDFVALPGQTLFNGLDPNGNQQLWTTNGRATGTAELVLQAASPSGLDPSDLTAFGSGALFAGADPSGIGLWYTNGNAAGTMELTAGLGIPGGPDPADITALANGRGLFSGFDSIGDLQLYGTDGTAAGTAAIAVPGASVSGLDPSGITAFGSGALFFGFDATGADALYATDGTAAGTTELLAEPPSASGSDLAVSGRRAFFASGQDLAVSDGTAAGTTVLAVQDASAIGVQPADLTAFGIGALFSGVDAAGSTGLWISDGTAAGTAEITPAGAAGSGLAPSGITAFGADALFAGTDGSGRTELWITDGTAAGTTEIVPAGSDASGLAPNGITVDGGRALFQGLDASGDPQLWVTDGTAAGTIELPAAAFGGGLTPTELTDGYFNPACYRAGTLILTPAGEVPVETLAAGDPVVTGNGAAAVIKWVGRRSYGARWAARNAGVVPIRFRAGCLGDGLPRRDLLVSPRHAMLLAGVLVAAEDLVDGVDIVRDTDRGDIHYVHIELDRHDVILAEGAPSETFVDVGSRACFQNAAEHPGSEADGRVPATYCAPRISAGYALQAIRERLAAIREPAVRAA